MLRYGREGQRTCECKQAVCDAAHDNAVAGGCSGWQRSSRAAAESYFKLRDSSRWEHCRAYALPCNERQRLIWFAMDDDLSFGHHQRNVFRRGGSKRRR